MDIVELESDYLLMYVLVTLINRLRITNIDKYGIDNSREKYTNQYSMLNSKL